MSKRIKINITPDQNVIVNPITLNQGVINHSVTHQSGSSDELLHNLLGGLQGGLTNQYYHISSGQYFNLTTGDVVRPSETGQFYPMSNPSGFTTGGDLSLYATKSFVTGVSGVLQIQITDINNSGFITGINNLVYTTGDQIVTDHKTFTDHLILQRNGNQLMFRTGIAGNTIFITTPAIFGNRTYTIPDVGHSCAFVMNNGPQTISGLKDFAIRPTVDTTNVALISDFTNLVYTTGNQAIGGDKTFSNDIIGNGTDNLFVNEAGFSPHSLLTQQQLMLGGHKFRQLVNVNSKRSTIPLTTTIAGPFQTLGMISQVGIATGQFAASYTLDGVFCADASTAALPINNEIDVFFHGVAMQFQTDANWVARINIGVPFSKAIPYAGASAASGTDKQWGVQFYYNTVGSQFVGQLYYYFDALVYFYGTPFALPIYTDGTPAAWQGFIYSIRMRQVPLGSNRLRLEFYMNNSVSNIGGGALSKTTPLATLTTVSVPTINYKFAGKHINFETATSTTVASAGIVRMQSTNMYCQFK